MKLIFSSIFLVSQLTVFSQNWFTEGDHWVYNSSGFLYHAFVDMTVGKDTVLLGKEAKVLNFYTVDSDDVGSSEPVQEYIKIAYEEDKRVYIYSNITQSFELNYDFNLALGESLFYDLTTFNPNCQYTIEYRLDSISYLHVGPDSLMVQHFDIITPISNNFGNRKLIERIGNLGRFEIVRNHDYCSTDGPYTSLCYFNDSNYFESSVWDFYCSDVISSVEEKISHVKIYPNPTSDKVYIDSDKSIQSILVKDINGRNVMRSIDSAHIDLSSLINGLYILIVSSNQQLSAFRVIKQ